MGSQGGCKEQGRGEGWREGVDTGGGSQERDQHFDMQTENL